MKNGKEKYTGFSIALICLLASFLLISINTIETNGIVIDGEFKDWSTVPNIVENPAGDSQNTWFADCLLYTSPSPRDRS